MTAIIKKNFRLQNARDFLENFINHPRLNSNNEPVQIEQSFVNVEVDSTNSSKGNSTYTWSWTISDSVDTQDDSALKADALIGLKESLGAHVVDRNHYLFVGKTIPWKTSSGQISLIDELSPPLAKDSIEAERRIWDEMLGLKKINNASASLVVPRVDWDASGKTVYAIYDDTKELHLEPTEERRSLLATENLRAGSFYVLTDQYDLFICIENGNNSPSQEKPVRLSDPTSLIQMNDGYVWKFVTTIKSGDAVKFLTDSWIPVKTLAQDDGSQQWLVQESATPGSVLSFVIEDPSQNYNNVHNGKFDSVNSESGLGTAILTTVVDGPSLSGITNAYTNTHLYIKTGVGAGDVYRIASYDPILSKITLDSNWLPGKTPEANTEYEILPIISVESNGTSEIKIKPVVVNGQLKRIIVREAGANASYVKVTVADDTAGGGSGTAKAKARAILSPKDGLCKDPEKDLNAFFVMMNARLQYNEGDGDFPISNDYRQLGIIRNVLDSDGNLAKSDTLSAVKSMILELSSERDVLTDQIITQTQSGGIIAKGIVIETLDDPAPGAPALSRKISYIQTPETGFVPFVLDSTKKVVDNLGDIGVISSLTNEEVKKFSGEILYVENRRPILRAEDQLEDIKAIIEF